MEINEAILSLLLTVIITAVILLLWGMP